MGLIKNNIMTNLSYYLIGLSLGLASIYGFKKLNKIHKVEGNDMSIYKYLRKKGFSKANASGIVGNLYVESKFDPNAIGDNGASYGIAQWNKTRWDSLVDYANQRNLDASKVKTQLDFMIWELQNTEKKAYSYLIRETEPSDSAYAFAKWYERPRVIVSERMIYAENFYNNLK